MRRHFLAFGLSALCLALAPTLALAQDNTAAATAGAGAISATDQAVSQQGGGAQSASQDATNVQVLPVSVAPAVSAQVAPINLNLPVRILSAGDDAAPAQSNSAPAQAQASNVSAIDQAVRQSGADKKDAGSQSASQSATNVQVAPISVAPAVAAQVAPVNANLPVRVLSPGDNAAPEQSNAAVADAEAANVAHTGQVIRQSGDDKKGYGGAGSQSASQSATNLQLLPIGLAPAVAAQVLPVNLNLPVRILSAGDDPAAGKDGQLQSNAAIADAAADNVSAIDQAIGQAGAGSQSASQSATNLQLVPIGLAPAVAAQVLPLNVNAPVRILDDGLPPLPVDPFALLADPVGTVLGVVGSLPLSALPVDPFALLADPVGTVLGAVGSLPLGAVTGLVGGLPLGAVTGLVGGLPLGAVTGLLPLGAVTGLLPL